MDLQTLIALYPIAEKFIKISPKVKEWIEKKAKKDDPYLFLHLEILQSRLEMLESRLETPIITAMLSNPSLTVKDIEEKLIKSIRVARNLSKIVREF